jgi:hypothetical protein
LGKAREIAFRRLDFDHFGTQIGQHSCGMRTRKHAGEVKNANALKWALAPCLLGIRASSQG